MKRLVRGVAIVIVASLAAGTAAAYAGVEPFVAYKDMVGDEVARLAGYASSGEAAYPYTRELGGTYTTTIPLLNSEQKLIFKGDTLTIVDEFTGTNVYRYTVTMQSESEGMLDAIHVGAGESLHVPLDCVEEADCLVLYARGRGTAGVTYCK